MAGAAFLADPGLVLEPERDPLAGVEALAPARLDLVAQVGQGPARQPVAFPVGSAQDQARKGRLLALAQPRLASGPGPVHQPAQALSVEAHHRVPQRLAVHAAQPGGLDPAHAVQHMGDRVDARRHARPPLAPGLGPQLSSNQLRVDRQAAHQALLARWTQAETQPPRAAKDTNESPAPLTDILCCSYTLYV